MVTPASECAAGRVLVISGSVRRPSYTAALAGAASAALTAGGAEVDWWDVGEIALPVADPAFHRDPRENPDPTVRRLVDLADMAEAIVLASPLYHNSYSGVLKNALDHLSMTQFGHKPVGLLGHGRNRSTQAVDQLRTVVRGLRGVTTTTPLCTMDSDFAVDSAGEFELVDMDIRERVKRFTEELLAFSVALRMLRITGH